MSLNREKLRKIHFSKKYLKIKIINYTVHIFLLLLIFFFVNIEHKLTAGLYFEEKTNVFLYYIYRERKLKSYEYFSPHYVGHPDLVLLDSPAGFRRDSED